MMPNKQRADLTFKDNVKRGRHGWVRLTPAYSVKIVQQILIENPNIQSILEPFSGTGTTGLVAAQSGLQCDLLDINPFLVWLARVKCANYETEQLKRMREAASVILEQAKELHHENDLWQPPINHIERWWSDGRLHTLSKIFHVLHQEFPTPSPEKDLLLIAFCRLIMRWSNAAFNHQSMSFKKAVHQLQMFDEEETIYQSFLDDVTRISQAANEAITGIINVFLHDSRQVMLNGDKRYDAVITSPPYVNRMSYIRELRPYMYWLGYLKKAREAGELDWQAIGGTWGIATSRLNDWQPDDTADNIPQLKSIVDEIAQSSEVLSRYVHKYFADIAAHFANLNQVVKPGGKLYYIIGNSKFYDTLVPVEQIYADLMEQHGFIDVQIKTIRKRNSKKELYEFLVSAQKPR
ncbi:MAG: SAM-dependent methyltransferase [Chloroflexi bacterium]|nr:MAG: SAM-dependent methyltransferase [Phototrophicales bacterium]RMF82401.1 MAG: SAM-dependent methyltransferase [Chloroflexota bacterium]